MFLLRSWALCSSSADRDLAARLLAAQGRASDLADRAHGAHGADELSDAAVGFCGVLPVFDCATRRRHPRDLPRHPAVHPLIQILVDRPALAFSQSGHGAASDARSSLLKAPAPHAA